MHPEFLGQVNNRRLAAGLLLSSESSLTMDRVTVALTIELLQCYCTVTRYGCFDII